MERQVISKVMWRLIPMIIFLYILNYLDRVNVGIAKLQMKADLGMSEGVFAFGFSIFFIGYCVFEVPSNIMMAKVGARFWIARIMVSWGICSVAMMFVKGETSFYIIRFLLGVAEAGFFPGMILYLSYWIPARERSKAGAFFLTATALAQFIGQPLGTSIMKMNGVGGMTGWQWLFLLEGMPTIFIGFIVYLLLDDGPANCKWLNDDERTWLLERMHQENAAKGHGAEHHDMSLAFKDKNALMLCVVYCMLMLGFYLLQYWTPTIIKNVTHEPDDRYVGIFGAIPFLAAAIQMALIGKYSDACGAPAKCVSYSCFAGAVGLAVVAVFFKTSAPLTVAGLTLAAMGIFGTLGPFWALPSQYLSGVAAAAGIALINSAGNLNGGFVGNNVMGYSKQTGLIVDAAALIIAGIITLRMHLARTPAATSGLKCDTVPAGTGEHLVTSPK